MTQERLDLKLDDIVSRKPIRADIGDISMLTASVRKLGLLEPVLVDRHNVLIAGNRRLAACREAGLTTVPAIRMDFDHDSMMALDMQVDLNLCREPLGGEDVDRLIQRKKSCIARSAAAEGGMLDRLKRAFGSHPA